MTRPCPLAWLAVVALQPAIAQTLQPYDDFSGSDLSSTRWQGDESRQSGGDRLEGSRSLVDGQLRLATRGVGDAVRDAGATNVRQSVVFARGDKLTAMKATITMRSVTQAQCGANLGTNSLARARLFGYFFNAGVQNPGSLNNDVYAMVQIARLGNTADLPGTFRVSGFVGICTDETCVSSVSLGGQEFLTGVTLNSPLEVSVTWDKAGHQFKFTAGGASLNVPYTVKEKSPAGVPAKRMEVNNVMPNCIAGRIAVAATADFDDVYVNPEALP